MATVSDLTITPVSGLNHIDALLDVGPDWNFVTGLPAPNTIYYTFSISSGNESGVSGHEAFTLAQQNATYTAFAYLQRITGIQFVETAIGSNAQIHLANLNLDGSNTTGLCSWQSSYSYASDNTLVEYTANAYVYLDNVEWRAQNRDLDPGGSGYQTLLHELGHAMGLKHSFEGITLPGAEDNTNYTLMSYNDVGGPHSSYSPYDIAAFDWLYGRDGLRGALGINSTGGGRYISGSAHAEAINGTAGDDVLVSGGGNDAIDGGAGNDTVVLGGLRSEYTISNGANGSVVAAHATRGTVTIANVEQFAFSDIMVGRSQLMGTPGGGDTTPPPAPTLSVPTNAAGYAAGNRPAFSGQAEAGALVRVYAGDLLVAETQAAANGSWSAVPNAFADGMNYAVRATATDAAGNVSSSSGTVSFHVDATAPLVPTLAVAKNSAGYAAGNQPQVSGQAEAGALVSVYAGDQEVAQTRADASGKWLVTTSAFADGLNYAVRATATDAAGNVSVSSAPVSFHVDATAPAKPTLVVAKNAGGYIAGNQAQVSGQAEAGALVQVYEGNQLVAETRAGATGAWTVATSVLADGLNHTLRATATDAAGNVSVSSALASFHVEATAPAAPTLAVSKNAAGYTAGNKPLVTGEAEAGSLVRVYAGNVLVAETRADDSGLWTVVTSAFADGLNYTLRATATDAAGNVSVSSGTVSFHVDATAPVKPTSVLALQGGGNQPVFSGTGEAGTTIEIVRIKDATVIGRTEVNSNGSWKLDSAALPNGSYEVAAVSIDRADNATSADNRLNFNINSALNLAGNNGNDRFTPGAGNNAIDGMDGLDTVSYAGLRGNFTIERGVYGVTVTDKSGALGSDNLVNVERIQFGDTMVALDIDGAAGEVYRLYRAAFDREPDKGGLAFWIKALDSGKYSLNDISAMFLADREARELYASDPSDAYFVTKLYAHVLHRPAEGAGFDYWVKGLELVSRAEVLAFFSESVENQAQVIGVINNGIEFPLG
ncbi:Ig-like domain-containing protein [Massilia oculi]|uniref:Ig-like domain-containing protein n=1 Tax=Massilia hydrophila TaxID=3044279 RepID=A0ABS7YC33_9BURK|nr:Ig-like domain-containing protein [Massilia oculi]MCA1857261.1 Ig-like domain-containing protein [Massilia oculi]